MKTRDLRLLILHVSTRCDQACGHCSVWRPPGGPLDAWGRDERLRLIENARRDGADTLLLTGGEPLLCDHIESLARRAHELGYVVHLATNGLGLARATPWLQAAVDEVFVSFEGPAAIHDSVRGAGMASRLHASMRALVAASPRPRIVARCTLSALNAASVETTVSVAREMGFDAISFLPVDTTSSAFGGRPDDRAGLRPSREQVSLLRRGILSLAQAGELGAFVVESKGKLMQLADALEASGDSVPGRCNAPEWSAVVEANGEVRPCFFQPTVSGVRGEALGRGRQSAAWVEALDRLGPRNPTCATCVCPKFIESALSLRERVARKIRAAAPRFLPSVGAA